jgi:Kef-type K+ transport system membrane component KefB
LSRWRASGWEPAGAPNWADLNRLEATQLGAGMISRGEVGLIVADVGIRQGFILENEFSAVIMMVLVTTLITPPILRALFARKM